MIEQRDDRFATFERKSFLSEILGVQKAFELFRRDQFPKQLLLDLDRNRFRLDKLAAYLIAHPELFFLALNVPILDADFAAIGALQNVENLAQRGAVSARQSVGNEFAIEIPNRKSVSFNIEFRMIEHRHRVQRIDVGDQVAAHAIGIDQLDDASFLGRLFVAI